MTTDDHSYEVRMALAGGVVKQLVAEPTNPPGADRIPITEAHRRGIVDPITGSIMPVTGTGEVLSPAACQRTLPMFDGRQRFDVTLTFKRMDEVKAEKGYQGPVVVCQILYKPVAGHRPERYSIKYLTAQRDMEVWLAPIAGTRLLVPFRVSVPTLLGLGVL